MKGYTRASQDWVPRLIAAVDGLPGTGKTRLALTCPGPIAYFNFDVGLDGVVQQFPNADLWFPGDGEPYILPDFLPHDDDEKRLQQQAAPLWERFCRDFCQAVRDARTVVVDTATEAYELSRLAHFGKLEGVRGRYYGELNQEWRTLMRHAVHYSTANLLMLHHLKDEYVNDSRTGNKLRSGWGGTEAAAFVSLLLEGPPRKPGFTATITKCRQNSQLTGVALEAEDISIPMVGTLVFPSTGLEEWQ